MANREVASNFNQISGGEEKKAKKNGFLCVPIAVAQAGGRGGEGI